ncbi:MAG: cysteine desulfurase [Gemmatimonadales bacterium]
MTTTAVLDVARIRADFPILDRVAHGRPLVYLDSAASAQKPRAVIDAVRAHYETRNANVHRGVHLLSQEASGAYEDARTTAARFLGAAETAEVVFAHGNTSAINLVARAWGDGHIKQGDHILVSELEHHSNIVPWQQLAIRKGGRVVKIPITDSGEIDLDAYKSLLSDRTKIVAVSHVSNVLGTIVPIQQMADLAHEAGALLLVDGAQGAPHLPTNVQALHCDFYTCSGHKVYGPTGVGLLWGRKELLDAMPPYEGGGGMIDLVTFEKTTYAKAPARFEAGTPPVEAVVGLAAALNWLRTIDADALQAHEHDLLEYATGKLGELPGITILGTAPQKASVLSFVMDGVHAHDVGTILDTEGVAIRAGHHCAQPLMARYGVASTARASFCAFNTRDEVDVMIAGLHKVREVFG